MTDLLPRHHRVVLWGFTESKDSFRHVMRHYAHALERAGKPCVWIADEPGSRGYLEPGDLVFAVDVESKQLGSAVSGVDYLLHNMDSSHPVFATLEPERLLRLQVYTDDAEQHGVAWGPVRRYDRETRTLFQPWGTDLLADEFMPPTFRGGSRTVAFVGSVWDDNGLGNVHMYEELGRLLEERGLELRHHVHVTDEENMRLVRNSRIAPAFTGRWQVEHNYLPCRVFKNVSYGQLAVTNVVKFTELFDLWDSSVEGDIADQVDHALSMPKDRYLAFVEAQQQVVAEYTYHQSLEAISRAFEEGR